MFSSKVFIINNKSLYDVLQELKNQFFFELFHIKNIDEFIDLKKKEKIENFIIVVTKDIKSQIGKDYFLKINNFPIKIFDLIQKINIKILKSSFNFKSNIKINNYTIDLNSRNLLKGSKFLKLTEKEINLLLYLKKQSHPQKVNKLQENVWGYSNNLETHTVETHIYRLRKKILQTFNDNNFIISQKNGYQIS